MFGNLTSWWGLKLKGVFWMYFWVERYIFYIWCWQFIFDGYICLRAAYKSLICQQITILAIVIPLFGFELIQWCILIVQIIKKSKMNKLEQKKQSGGQNQNGCQAWIFYSSVNFCVNQLNLEIRKECLVKKIA
jgi:hypothetical protein